MQRGTRISVVWVVSSSGAGPNCSQICAQEWEAAFGFIYRQSVISSPRRGPTPLPPKACISAAERSDLGDVDVGRRETSRCEEPTDIAKLLLTRHDLTLCHRLAGVRFLSVFTPLMTNTDGDDSSELLQGLPSTFLPEPRVTHSRALEPAASSWFGFGASRPRLSAGGRQTQQLP